MTGAARAQILIAFAAAAAACSDVGDDVLAPADQAELAAPPSGRGLQFGSEDIQVPCGTETQDCYFFKVSDLARLGGLDATRPLNLHRVQVAQREGTHHL